MSAVKTILIDPAKTFPFGSLRDVIETYWSAAAQEYNEAPTAGHPYRKLQILAEWLREQNAPVNSSQPIAEVIDSGALGGVCPQCYRTDGYVNIGKEHWGICDVHRVRWPIGYNLFSECKDEPWELQQQVWSKVALYEVVESGSCDELVTSACPTQDCQEPGAEPKDHQV
jgi:hypothetical protein